MAEAYPAARLFDPVAHSLGLLGMIGGALLGAVVGGLLIGAAVLSGGGLLIAAVAAVGAVGVGGLSGGQLARGLQQVCHIPDPQTGVIGPTTSPDVHVGGKPSARAVIDTAVQCHGLWALAHWPYGPVAIAEGAQTVLIDGYHAARVTSKLVCGAAIKAGEDTVLIGGPTVRLLEVSDLEAELTELFTAMAWISAIGLAVLAPATIPLLAGFMAINYALGEVGDMIGPGWRDILQGGFGIGTLIYGGARTLRPGSASELAPIDEPRLGEEPVTTKPVEEPVPPEEPAPKPGPAREARLAELAKDPAQGGKSTPKTQMEAEAALGLEESGQLKPDVTRSEDPKADFVDGDGQLWDVKTYNSKYKNGFEPEKVEAQILKEFANDENVILDTRNLSPQDLATLHEMVESHGWSDRVLWYP